MPEPDIRKMILTVEEIFHEGGPPADTPPRRGACLAVLANPFAGRYVADIQPFMEDLKPLGLQMAQRLIAAMGGCEAIEGYGKAALVGADGELEHGALWHAPGGYAMRALLGEAKAAKAIVPSAKKVGGVGARIDVPITHVSASYVRSHFDSMEVGLSDAPRASEWVVALVMTTGPRVHARAGGLQAQDIEGKDGLR
ncbi:MAG: amino acid synthesis family protein [Rhodobacteraceae bacterium]|nr:amino acid synthesis family protein [Paracoccaceae bacterium]